jgi:cell division ATPase FtsA
MGEEQVLEKIQESINKHFHNKDIKFSSFLMTSFAVARDMFVHEENFLLVDIGGEITDISMVKKNVLRSSISFPLGKNFFIRGIKEKLSCSLDEAKSFLSLYKDGHGSESVNERLTPVVLETKKEWLKKFQESLASITNDISIPSIVFVTVDEDLALFFIETIKTEQFNQYSLTDSKFKIVFLGNQALHGIVLFGDDTARDPFLILESIYINRFLS